MNMWLHKESYESCGERRKTSPGTPEVKIDRERRQIQTGGQDGLRINVYEDSELRDPSKRVGVKPERLKELVRSTADRLRYTQGPRPELALCEAQVRLVDRMLGAFRAGEQRVNREQLHGLCQAED